ncbi:hypothetical protein ACFL59_03085 [Planctomycetota bacterium]
MGKTKSRRRRKRRQPDWDKLFAKTDAPTEDFIEPGALTHHCNLEEVLENLLFALKGRDFLRWEAVIADENDLPMTEAQEDALDELIGFGDDDDRILWINDSARPSEPWYKTVCRVAAALLVEPPFNTSEGRSSVTTEGWAQLVACLEEHAGDLCRPPGVQSAVDVIPTDLQHRLWLQSSFFELEGVGQPGSPPLSSPEQHWRLPAFIEALKEHRDGLEHLRLTLDGLFEWVVMPPEDERYATEWLVRELGLESSAALLAEARGLLD